MLNVLKKELKISFVTPFGYVLIAGVMVLSGFFFFSLLQNFNYVSAKSVNIMSVKPNLNEWVILPYYQTLEIILIFLVPILTMKSFAEEKKNGTFEMLITSPLSIFKLVLGKYLGISIVAGLALCSSFSFCAALIYFTEVETLPALVGFLGLIFSLLSFLALSLGVASFASSQTVAGVVSLVTLLVLYAIDAPATQVNTSLVNVLSYLAPSTHALNLFKGILQSEDLIYFLSLIALGLFIANRSLETWRRL
ncbi:MAG: ABC transporter permease [Deltaproteobacteria bacterium]|jgi:ABC-2 type transport system permease protein|nr:ABC transporter permease [Deltaproteobacteria bacterium]